MRVKYVCFAKTRENEKELQKIFGGKKKIVKTTHVGCKIFAKNFWRQNNSRQTIDSEYQLTVS